jgi:hypothetical protein
MNNRYTRQRQGRDFTLLDEINHLRNAEMRVEAGYSRIDGLIGNSDTKDDYSVKTLLEQIESGKAASERNAAPVDGHEPQERSR